MRQSKLFTKTRREGPKDEVSVNANLLIRAGFIHKEMAGVYSLLPLGLIVYKKIENIIREEMNAIGGQEMLMTSFQPKENWQKTGRWETMDDLYKVSDSSKREVALGATHEELIVPIAKEFALSYKDFPFSVYQFQTKFRMEMRAKSGILRGREFIMKDMYSFHKTTEDMDEYYETVKKAYERIFERCGIGEKTFLTFALGGSFSKYSHEFQTLTDAGEDLIYIDKKKKIAINKEALNDEVLSELGLKREDLVEEKAVEVGNIFKLKTKYSAPFDMTFKNEKGEPTEIMMGCYGIGLSRLIGTIVEASHDEKGIVWTSGVAPFSVHIASVGNDEAVLKEAKNIHDALEKENISVLWDDRDVRPGEKFADSDLIGIPVRIVVSQKTIEAGLLEVKNRKSGDVKNLSLKEIIAELK